MCGHGSLKGKRLTPLGDVHEREKLFHCFKVGVSKNLQVHCLNYFACVAGQQVTTIITQLDQKFSCLRIEKCKAIGRDWKNQKGTRALEKKKNVSPFFSPVIWGKIIKFIPMFSFGDIFLSSFPSSHVCDSK